MQGAEIKDEGSVLKYTTKSEFDEQRSSLYIMTQLLYFVNFYIITKIFCQQLDLLTADAKFGSTTIGQNPANFSAFFTQNFNTY